MMTTWYAVAIALLASSVAASRLARERGRDEYFYFFTGLALGPVSLLMVITPLPCGSDRRSEVANRPIRFVKGQPCPGCRREVGVRSTMCPHCGASLETAWWENQAYTGH